MLPIACVTLPVLAVLIAGVLSDRRFLRDLRSTQAGLAARPAPDSAAPVVARTPDRSAA